MTSSIHQQPVTLLQQLIRFDTTNPPGNESECISFINNLLTEAGVQTTILAKTPARPNLVARLPGQGRASPLLLYGHVDVVTTENQDWQIPPFEGRLEDGYIWGRGALDMKAGVAMMLSAFLRAKVEQLELPGDVVLAIVCDEEALGDYGARFLVECHPEQFEGVHYALGEFGGFTITIGNRRFYPIMVAEKQICQVKATLRGPGGHGSMPVRGGAMARLARFLLQLDQRQLPVHVTPVARQMFQEISSSLGGISGLILGQISNPILTNTIISSLGERVRTFTPLFYNTISPTILQASSKINVIPAEVSVELDGRLLPGYQPADMINELRRIIDKDVELEVLRYDPGPAEPDMGLFEQLAGILRQADPQGQPVPLLLSGVTDGRYFSRLGIQTYGFLPMILPEGFDFSKTIHAANERIPIEALDFGARAIFQALRRHEP